MADITVTAAKVAPVHPNLCEIYDFIATEAITAGQPVYILTTGKVGVADANAAGKEQVRGIALKSVGAGQAVSVLKRGTIEGFDVSGLNRGVILYLSDTAGSLADATGTKTVKVGRVMSLADANLTKVVNIETDWINSPARPPPLEALFLCSLVPCNIDF